jgi:hypothetical protein
LENKYKEYNGFRINFVIAGVNIPNYKENEFFEVIRTNNIHTLTLLNKWGETYCYALSKFLKSGLPIFYNGIGAVAERIPAKSHYMKVFDHEIAFDEHDKEIICNKFEEMINYIIENNTNAPSPNINMKLSIPKVYKDIFESTKRVQIIEVKEEKEIIFGVALGSLEDRRRSLMLRDGVTD